MLAAAGFVAFVVMSMAWLYEIDSNRSSDSDSNTSFEACMDEEKALLRELQKKFGERQSKPSASAEAAMRETCRFRD